MIFFTHFQYSVIESDAVAPSFLKTKYQLPTTDLDLPKVPSVS
jgi:ATP-dependent RNA helicase DDX51/DBP6